MNIEEVKQAVKDGKLVVMIKNCAAKESYWVRDYVGKYFEVAEDTDSSYRTVEPIQGNTTKGYIDKLDCEVQTAALLEEQTVEREEKRQAQEHFNDIANGRDTPSGSTVEQNKQARVIKFRMWDQYNKKMVPVDVLAITECSWMCPDSGRQGVSLAYQSHIPVMQYTGLKDKNGKEIYEGDILADGEGIGVVHYYAPQFAATTPDGIFALNKGKVNTGDLKETRIIGNIYENPELLTQ